MGIKKANVSATNGGPLLWASFMDNGVFLYKISGWKKFFRLKYHCIYVVLVRAFEEKQFYCHTLRRSAKQEFFLCFLRTVFWSGLVPDALEPPRSHKFLTRFFHKILYLRKQKNIQKKPSITINNLFLNVCSLAFTFIKLTGTEEGFHFFSVL